KELKEQAKYYQMELNIAQAENESKDLRLRNRRLEQRQLEDELTHKQLETETAKLKLQNMDIELANAAIKHKNDSLEQCTQAALLDEYKLRMEAQRQSEKSHHIMIVAAAAIALLIIGGLSLFQYRRQRQIKQLQCMNERLQTAYDLLKQTTTAKELMESELRIAHDIQTSMVPHDFPERRNIDLYAQLKPAKAVGGDLYDFIFFDDKFYFCIGDVAGKGVPASMLMSATINLFRMTAKEGFPPEYIATKLNDTLSTDNQDGMFVTMFIGVIDMSSGHMDYCNAGHNPPLLDGAFMDVESNAPIGLWPDIEFVGQQVDYVKNKMLFLYTDGVSEAENTAQEQFGEERLQALIHLNNMESSRQTIETTIKAVTHFVGDAEQSDDLTMMCIKVIA
ncbi:MAG: serine/threonine-protein phosphatase, partial [Prevotella sp.]|nr:serine/threonine-protein phosphatase [Prevotella sp.]